jgi:transcriptional regulator with XRE-family HTH domain
VISYRTQPHDRRLSTLPYLHQASPARKDKRRLTNGAQNLGGLLREWRHKRRMRQFDLAADVEISTRRLGLMEAGRLRPSRGMLLHLATCLDVPLRQKNALLSAAGFDPLFKEHGFHVSALDIFRRGIETVLAAHDPCPALAVDRHWTILSANRAVAHLVAGAEPLLLRPPVNVVRLFLHPAGLASRIVNLAQWRAHVISRLLRQIDLTGDPKLLDMAMEVRDYPSPRDNTSPEQVESGVVATPFRLATIDGVLSFFNTTTSFSTPVDITVSELAIEAFLPADAETAEIMRRVAERDSTDPTTVAQSTVELV